LVAPPVADAAVTEKAAEQRKTREVPVGQADFTVMFKTTLSVPVVGAVVFGSGTSRANGWKTPVAVS
jgi:hypothetical protein